ncbi:hypothetical protein GOODEAATRI_020221, partial [Goodea atripinnis]
TRHEKPSVPAVNHGDVWKNQPETGFTAFERKNCPIKTVCGWIRTPDPAHHPNPSQPASCSRYLSSGFKAAVRMSLDSKEVRVKRELDRIERQN